MADLIIYPGSFVIDSEATITCVDADEVGDLDGYTSATVTYESSDAKFRVEWDVVKLTKIHSKTKRPDGSYLVLAVIIQVIPRMLLPKVSGLIFKPFDGEDDKKDDPGGSGTLTGTLNPPPPPPPPPPADGGPANPPPHKQPRRFQVDKPRVFLGAKF